MFEHATRQRYSSDCGIAALASASPYICTWGLSFALCFGLSVGAAKKQKRFSVSCEMMGEAIRRLMGETPQASGASLTQAKGSKGVVCCRVEYSEGHVSGKHWLAWEKDSEGRVWCFNPSDGEVFRAESMQGRGFYPLCHFTVA